MPKHKSLTDTSIARVKSPKKGTEDHFDLGYPGLHIRVSHTGRIAWGYYCRHRGKQIRLGFGTYPATTVEEAHDAWRTARDQIAAGRDPHPAEAPTSTDVRGVVEEWLKRDQAGNRSGLIVKQAFEREVLPQWGHREITDIGRRDALDLIDRIADRGHPQAARRMHAQLHRFFRWAVGRGILTNNPIAFADMPGEMAKRDRVLTDDELVKVWKAAERFGYPYGSAMQMLILTGARREEIAGLRWDEINDVIDLKAERTKNGQPHTIPLSSVARSVLGNVIRIAGPYVFTAKGKNSLQAWSRFKRELDQFVQIEPWRTHDIRRTVATGLQKQGVALQVTEAILGHTAGSRGGIIGVYQRHHYSNEKAVALEAWGAHVLDLVMGRKAGKVVSIRASRN